MKADQQETLAERVISACIYVLLSTTNGGAVAETESITLSDQGLAAVEQARDSRTLEPGPYYVNLEPRRRALINKIGARDQGFSLSPSFFSPNQGSALD